MTLDHLDPVIRHAADTAAGAAILASLAAWAPPIAAVLGAAWYLIQMYSWAEKRWKAKRRLTRKRR